MIPNGSEDASELKDMLFPQKYKVTRRLPGGRFEVMWAKIHIFAVT
jgi:hypothetical protein